MINKKTNKKREHKAPLFKTVVSINNDGNLIIYELIDVIDGDVMAISAEDRVKIDALVLQKDGAEMLLDLENKLRLEADLEIYEEHL